MTCIDCKRKGCKETHDGVCRGCRRDLDKRIKEIGREARRRKRR